MTSWEERFSGRMQAREVIREAEEITATPEKPAFTPVPGQVAYVPSEEPMPPDDRPSFEAFVEPRVPAGRRLAGWTVYPLAPETQDNAQAMADIERGVRELLRNSEREHFGTLDPEMRIDIAYVDADEAPEWLARGHGYEVLVLMLAIAHRPERPSHLDPQQRTYEGPITIHIDPSPAPAKARFRMCEERGAADGRALLAWEGTVQLDSLHTAMKICRDGRFSLAMPDGTTAEALAYAVTEPDPVVEIRGLGPAPW